MMEGIDKPLWIRPREKWSNMRNVLQIEYSNLRDVVPFEIFFYNDNSDQACIFKFSNFTLIAMKITY